MRVDRVAAARAVVLAVWAHFFVWLWLSGEAVRYVGPRTTWVVPFGAIALSAAAVGFVMTALESRSGAGARLQVRELVGLCAALAPVLAVLAVPAPTLGALAVERKSGGEAREVLPPPEASLQDEILSLSQASAAAASRDYRHLTRIEPGQEVDAVGFVSRAAEDGAATFRLSRFTAFCCAADALPSSITVKPTADGVGHPVDTWLRVSGTLESGGDHGFVVVAQDIREIDEPRNPYESN